MRACEPDPRATSHKPTCIFVSHCSFFPFFGVFNLTLTFFSVKATLGRRNTSFRFSFVRDISRKYFASVEGQFIVSDTCMNEISLANVDYTKLTNIQIYTAKRSSEANLK